MKIKVALLVVVIIAGLTQAFSGGDGTAGNPYQISTDIEGESNNG